MHVEPEPSSFFTDSCDALLFEYIHQFQKDPSNLRCLSFSLLSTGEFRVTGYETNSNLDLLPKIF